MRLFGNLFKIRRVNLKTHQKNANSVNKNRWEDAILQVKTDLLERGLILGIYEVLNEDKELTCVKLVSHTLNFKGTNPDEFKMCLLLECLIGYFQYLRGDSQ